MSNKVHYDKDSRIYIFSCPHCKEMIEVAEDEVNCSIFRHAAYKNSFHQVCPHLPKVACDELVKNNLVYGCAKPFRLIRGAFGLVNQVEICDYC